MTNLTGNISQLFWLISHPFLVPNPTIPFFLFPFFLFFFFFPSSFFSPPCRRVKAAERRSVKWRACAASSNIGHCVTGWSWIRRWPDPKLLPIPYVDALQYRFNNSMYCICSWLLIHEKAIGDSAFVTRLHTLARKEIIIALALIVHEKYITQAFLQSGLAISLSCHKIN